MIARRRCSSRRTRLDSTWPAGTRKSPIDYPPINARQFVCAWLYEKKKAKKKASSDNRLSTTSRRRNEASGAGLRGIRVLVGSAQSQSSLLGCLAAGLLDPKWMMHDLDNLNSLWLFCRAVHQCESFITKFRFHMQLPPRSILDYASFRCTTRQDLELGWHARTSLTAG